VMRSVRHPIKTATVNIRDKWELHYQKLNWHLEIISLSFSIKF